MNYFATILPGLEDLLIEEIKDRCFEIVVTQKIEERFSLQPP